MKFLTNPKFLAIITIIASVLAFINNPSGQTATNYGAVKVTFANIVTIEHVLAGIIGLAAGILILFKKSSGLLIAKIWSLMSIPYFITGSNQGVNLAIAFQTITFNLSTTTAQSKIIDVAQHYTTFGVNIFGIIFLVLFLKARFQE